MPEIVRHKKTGGLYEVLFRGAVIHSDVPLSDEAPVTICRRIPDGQIVARFGPTPRGSFDVLHHSQLQTDAVIHDGAEVVVYRALNGGPVWARRASEMDDGRFEPVTPDPSTPGEVERLVDALIEAARFAGKTEAMGAWCTGKAADDLATARTALLSHITAARPEGAVPSWMPQAKDVAEAMQDGGHWRSCSGCHETNEGYETGHYPYSPVYQCHVGSGCHECGGIGVTWEPPIDEAALLRSAQAASRPVAPQDLAALSAAACPGEWCGHLLMEMTEADSDYCDALVNGHRSGRLVERSPATNPQDQE